MDYSKKEIERHHPVTIVCGADDKFSMPLAVTLFSALFNLNTLLRTEIYIIDGGISESNKGKINRTLKRTGKPFQLIWVPFDLISIKSLRETEFISKATYLRILIPDLLPSEVTKAIYLDCDMIVEANLMSLWEIDMDEKAAMGVQDFCFPYLSTPSAIANFDAYHFPPQTPYCNAGLIVMNVSYWRKHLLTKKIFEYLHATGQDLKHNDQEGINVIINGNWKLIDPCWNVTLSSIPDFGKGLAMSEADIQKCLKKFRREPFIIHFTSRHKPWHTGKGNKDALNSFYYDQYYFGRFYSYLKKSQWFHPMRFLYWVNYRKAILLFEYKIPRRIQLFKQARSKKSTALAATVTDEA